MSFQQKGFFFLSTMMSGTSMRHSQRCYGEDIAVSESYFTSKFETPKHRKRERKIYIINDVVQWWMKRCIFDIGYQSFWAKTEMLQEDTKDKKAFLGITIKEICLLWSNVVVLLWQALFLEALVETTLLDKMPHHIKVGFSAEDCMRTSTLLSNKQLDK